MENLIYLKLSLEILIVGRYSPNLPQTYDQIKRCWYSSNPHILFVKTSRLPKLLNKYDVFGYKHQLTAWLVWRKFGVSAFV
jgi:hypothetical protein